MRRKAVLIIHGFAGTPYDQEDFANYLKLETKYDVFQFTLPGHAGKIKDVKHQEWIEASENMLNRLIAKGYKRIYLIGHSMGGVIATYLAGKYSQVKKLFLAAPAFHYLHMEGDKIDLKDSLKSTKRIVKTYGKNEILDRFLKSGFSSAKEFAALVKEYYDTPRKVTCPTLIIYGKNDDVVPQTSVEYVYNNLSSDIKKMVYIDKVTHDVFRREKKEKIFEIAKNFLEHYERGGIYYD